MINKKDTQIQAYLNDIDSGPLLTKSQEGELIKSIEVYQKQILSEMIISKYSRQELYAYLLGLQSSGTSITDISKNLDEESNKESQQKLEKSFDLLVKELQQDNLNLISSLLEEVSLTGNIIHGVVLEIRKKSSRISSSESTYSNLKKQFPEVDETVIEIESLKDVKLRNKLNEFKQASNDLKSLESELSPFSFDDVKSIFSKIHKLESMASEYKNILIEKNLRLVISRAKRFRDKGLEFEDLIQEGNLGLMRAIDKFDSSKKTKISTYATWWIDQSIRRSISNKGKTVRVPTHIEWMETNLVQLIHKMTGTLKRPPTLTEISKESGIPMKTLEDLRNRAQHEIGIDEELSSGKSLSDTLPDLASENPFNYVSDKLMREKIRKIVSSLRPKDQIIIRLRFGIGEVPDEEGMTLENIANHLGNITKQGVRVRECNALKDLKKKMKGLSYE